MTMLCLHQNIFPSGLLCESTSVCCFHHTNAFAITSSHRADACAAETNAHLTLELDCKVYVFNKSPAGGMLVALCACVVLTCCTAPPGFWEGETNGVYGVFPSSHLKEIKE
jgi:hypothetical protein